MITEITVPGPPTPKLRHRDGIDQKTGRRFKFTPRKTVAFEHLVGLHARRAYWGAPSKAPIALAVIQQYSIPASWSKTETAKAERNLLAHTVKPDADNVTKAVKDALNEIVYCDDKQVVITLSFKRYSRTEETKILVYDATEIHTVLDQLFADTRPFIGGA
jgi:Holliday junction resolvase RusA-like endonuclease